MTKTIMLQEQLYSPWYQDLSNTKPHDGENAGHDMAIVREACNADAHAKIPSQFMTLLCP